jgi:hypothetical protein
MNFCTICLTTAQTATAGCRRRNSEVTERAPWVIWLSVFVADYSQLVSSEPVTFDFRPLRNRADHRAHTRHLAEWPSLWPSPRLDILQAHSVKAAVSSNRNNPAQFPGRVPHVRSSVHGPKKTGRSPSNAITLFCCRCPLEDQGRRGQSAWILAATRQSPRFGTGSEPRRESHDRWRNSSSLQLVPDRR